MKYLNYNNLIITRWTSFSYKIYTKTSYLNTTKLLNNYRQATGLGHRYCNPLG